MSKHDESSRRDRRQGSGQGETHIAGNRNDDGSEDSISTSAVLTSSRNRAIGEDGMTHGLRTHTYNIRARRRAAPIERAMKWNSRATRQRDSTARIQRGRQANRRAGRSPATRHHSHQDGAGNAPRQASTGNETGGEIIERRTDSKHTAIARLPAYRVEERDERDEEPTDPTDGTTNETRDETSRQASMTSQHIPHGRDENAADIAAEPAKQADREGTAGDTE